MCNIPELKHRKKSIERIRVLLSGLCEIKDSYTRELVIKEIKDILNSQDQIIEIKLQSGGDNGEVKT